MKTNTFKFSVDSLVTLCITLSFVVYFFLIIKPIFHDGIFITHDDVQIVRTQALYNELLLGQFPVRQITEFGNKGGYMLFNFYSPFIYYLGAFFHFMGLPIIKATKLIFITSFLVGCCGAAILAWVTTKKYLLSVVGTFLFISAPYYLYNAYHRGALAEHFGFSLLPWMLVLFLQLKKSSHIIWILLSSLCFGLLIFTHILTAMSCVGIICLMYFFDTHLKKADYIRLFITFLFGLCLSATFFLPGLLEKKYIIYDQTNMAKTGYLTTSISPLKLVMQSEVQPLLGLALSISLVIFLIVNTKKKLLSFSYVTLIALTLLFLISPVSDIVWGNFSIIRLFQFKYRLLTVFTVIGVFSTVLLLKAIKNKKYQYFISFSIICIAVWQSTAFYKPVGYNLSGIFNVEGPCTSSSWDNEHLGIWTKECLEKTNDYKVIDKLNTTVPIIRENINKNQREFLFETDKLAGTITLNKYYFPGWVAYDQDDTRLQVEPFSDTGVIKIDVPENTTQVRVLFQNTPVRTVANYISVISIGIWLIILFKVLFMVLPRKH